MKYPVGTLLIVKTTDEPVMVLAHLKEEYSVRRASQGRDGIYHTECEFQEFEVETPEDNVKRKLAFSDWADKFMAASREPKPEAKVN